MPKYSTGGSGGSSDGATCELCGAASNSLRNASIAGAQLEVCPDCAPHDDAGGKSDRDRTEPEQIDRRRKAAQNAARLQDAASGDGDYWVERGTDYEDDPLPYLVSGYDDRAVAARQDAGLTVEELAAELELDEDDLLAVEQGRAARAGVGGSVVRAIEERLDVELVDE